MKTEVKIIITMNEKEAIWLKELMQNPFNGVLPENEDDSSKIMRRMFWDALNGIGFAGHYNTKKIDKI